LLILLMNGFSDEPYRSLYAGAYGDLQENSEQFKSL